MKAFVFAMKKEAELLLARADSVVQTKEGYPSFYECSYRGHSFLVAISGIGKVFAGSSIAAIADRYPNVDGIINAGVGGSVDPEKAPLFSVIIGNEFIQHDLDTSPIGDPRCFISGIEKIGLLADPDLVQAAEKAAETCRYPHETGRICSGDRFIASPTEREAIRKEFGCLSCDMESAAFAQIAYVYELPFVAFRVISDVGDAPGEYERNLPAAKEMLLAIIDRLLA